MEKIIKPFEKSLFDDSLVDIGTDMIEVGIDSLLEDGLLKDVPIVGTVFKTGKLIYNLYDRNLLRQTLIFIQEFNKGIISYEKLKEYRSSIEDDHKKAEKELGRVLIILNRTIDFEKTIILARLYLAYINEKITWDDFIELSEVNERLFVNDISILSKIYINGMNVDKGKIHNFLRLVSVGLLKSDSRFDSSNCGNSIISSEPIDAVELTLLGDKFCSLIK
ncbi:hypothetical protein [Clostridium beijerinckii]|uniref:hypothetical protein n=1 Tax=Clostridium beijerinckii TaxID=1520 RepID=UPI0006BB4B59|nr:hypothetical protein [Clostridium beijerinckii]ALB46236.1 hypothetical protein X276_13825 [Clostridium beijerinckii NRRL B-598]